MEFAIRNVAKAIREVAIVAWQNAGAVGEKLVLVAGGRLRRRRKVAAVARKHRNAVIIARKGIMTLAVHVRNRHKLNGSNNTQ